MKSLIRPLRLWVSVCSVFSPAATTRRCLGRVQFHVQDLMHVSSPGIDTGNSPVGRPSPEVMGTYCTQNEHLLLELTQIVCFEGLVLKTPPLLRGLWYNLSVSSERIDLFQTHLPTRGGPIRCGFGRDRMTYAILRIWLCSKFAKLSCKKPSMWDALRVYRLHTWRVFPSCFLQGVWRCLEQNMDLRHATFFFCRSRGAPGRGGRRRAVRGQWPTRSGRSNRRRVCVHTAKSLRRRGR